MAFKAASSLLTLAALSGAAQAVDLCPKLDSIGHATPQTYVFKNLNWTLTQEMSGGWPAADDDFDESRVVFDVQSDFNGASVRCSAEGKEFSEEYLRQLAGRWNPTYEWYECEGSSKDVKTEFKMVWWNIHTVEIRQTWTCPTTGRPMRATGNLAFWKFDCEFGEQQQRTECLSRAGAVHPFEATIVEILPPPTRKCAAASKATPDWNVYDFRWVRRNSTQYYDLPMSNVTFRLTNDALDDYSPRLFCSESVTQGPDNTGGFRSAYSCGVFEANAEDVPETKFDFLLDENQILRIDQTWYCGDAGQTGTKFHSVGEYDVKSILSCSSETHPYLGSIFFETIQTCFATKTFHVEGTLQ